ncbi:hypothetical protein GmHk_14G041415 [Glycine max]|nr:hypothetical protein GmHk_14G041415 [Glycine max]
MSKLLQSDNDELLQSSSEMSTLLQISAFPLLVLEFPRHPITKFPASVRAFFYGTCSGYGPYMKKEGIDTFPSKEILYCFSEIHSLGKLGGVKLEFLDALRANSPSCILAFCSFRMLS